MVKAHADYFIIISIMLSGGTQQKVYKVVSFILLFVQGLFLFYYK